MGAVKEVLLVLRELEHHAQGDVWESSTEPFATRRRVFVDTGGRPIGEAYYEDEHLVAARWLADPAALMNSCS